jgi:hypothetical protein
MTSSVPDHVRRQRLVTLVAVAVLTLGVVIAAVAVVR